MIPSSLVLVYKSYHTSDKLDVIFPVLCKKVFVDAFWNSRRISFARHLFEIMTSWALVCDVYFLEPQTQR